MKTSIIRVLIIDAIILLVPFVAMQFTDDVDWRVSDFIIMGLLVFITGMGIEWAAKKIQVRPIGSASVSLSRSYFSWYGPSLRSAYSAHHLLDHKAYLS